MNWYFTILPLHKMYGFHKKVHTHITYFGNNMLKFSALNLQSLDSQIELWIKIWYMLCEWKTLIKIGKYAHFFCQRKINITKLSGWHNILSKETRHFMCVALMHAICTPPIFQNMNTSNITKHFYYYEKAHHMFLRKLISYFHKIFTNSNEFCVISFYFFFHCSF